MKIAINTSPLEGPWGGGNRFVRSLTDALQQRGHETAFNLASDVDLALIVDPRPRNPRCTFSLQQVVSHLHRRPQTIIVHRINECDERKGTRTMNARLRLANYFADYTVFIASWLVDLNVWRRETSSTVILNGSDERIFRRGSAATWDGNKPMRIVTHHWGAHANKGWDVYQRIDSLVGQSKWRDRIAFAYIGNAPAGAQLTNSVVHPPLDGTALAAALAAHHVYITASVNEPAGMHHIEGALVGLPLVFRRSGALPEYCSGFGEAFDGPADVVAALERMLDTYPRWKPEMANYPHTADRMTRAYVDLFERLYPLRESIATRRRLWRDPLAALLARVPL
jgi:hypothetical protein